MLEEDGCGGWSVRVDFAEVRENCERAEDCISFVVSVVCGLGNVLDVAVEIRFGGVFWQRFGELHSMEISEGGERTY